MNVKKLKALIADLPDDTVIVIDGFDHSYRIVNVKKETACWNEEEGDLTECYWTTKKEIEENLGEGYVRIPVLLVY